MKSPISYFGGKFNQAPWILSVLARYEHNAYVEAFGGAASVMFAKPPMNDVYNDIYGDLVNMWRVIRGRDTFPEFCRMVNLMPYARDNFYEQHEILICGTENPVERAAAFFVCQRQSFSGYIREKNPTWLTSYSESQKCKSRDVSAWLSGIDKLADAHARMSTVKIENLPAVEILKKYHGGNTLFYLDPPYVSDTRKNGGYRHEMDDTGHRELVATMLSVKGHKVLSGYESAIYAPLIEAGYTLLKKEYHCNAARTNTGKKLSKESTTRIECLYCSPGMSKTLFD